ncbi:hypothetical protein MRB53_026932 [Persea americana]|uniref:Uncharacterized protein n=1 Tax=Persea americana TaxID=3435 RepID=A0ACC2LJG0_PERAE|nr:hypothetical protein MRB53_026932 [Persea americana]
MNFAVHVPTTTQASNYGTSIPFGPASEDSSSQDRIQGHNRLGAKKWLELLNLAKTPLDLDLDHESKGARFLAEPTEGKEEEHQSSRVNRIEGALSFRLIMIPRQEA